MIRTHGITHVALAVADIERSIAFYHDVLGMEEYFRDDMSLYARTPGTHDVLTFDQTLPQRGAQGGIVHFGFRLAEPEGIDEAVAAAERTGGKLLRRGEISPGYPFAYLADPDGYEIEIWYE
jgi:catechol 2,3-dioxygenase-like lactoylglutathione lyase family enzyme